MLKNNNYIIILEEIFNAITHGLGVVMGIIGIIFLLKNVSSDNNNLKIVSFSIFGLALILLYLSSTLLHSLSFTKAKKVFTILDHSAIFVFISATYTPILLILFPLDLAKYLLAVIWSISIIGIILISVSKKILKYSVIIYLIQGWLSILLLKHILITASENMIYFLIAGGLFYTVGSLFYISKKIYFNHTIWHLFVIGGSVNHYLMLYYL